MFTIDQVEELSEWVGRGATILRPNLSKLCEDFITLRKAVEEHRGEKGHQRCHLDDDRLYAVLGDGVEADTSLPSREEFLSECERFWEHRQRPGEGTWCNPLKELREYIAATSVAIESQTGISHPLLAVAVQRLIDRMKVAEARVEVFVNTR